MTLEHDMIDTTADYCLSQLRGEANLLEQCQKTLAEVRVALREGVGEKLLSAMKRQQESEQSLAANRSERTRLVNRLAITMDVPATRATVGQLLLRLDPGEKHTQLTALRRRVRTSARQVERLCRGNAALIAHRLELMRRLLHALGAGTSDTYESNGEMDATADSPATITRKC